MLAVVFLAVVVSAVVVLAVVASSVCTFKHWYQFAWLMKFILRIHNVINLQSSNLNTFRYLSTLGVIFEIPYWLHFKFYPFFIAIVYVIDMLPKDTFGSDVYIF